MKKRDIITNIILILLTLYFIIVGLFLIWALVQKITGHSPTGEQIILVFLSVISMTLLSGGIYIGRFMGNVDATLKHQQRILNSIGGDFKAHINDRKLHKA